MPGVGLAHGDVPGFGGVGAHKGQLPDDAGAVFVEPVVAVVMGPVGRLDPQLAVCWRLVGVGHEKVVFHGFEPPVEVLAGVGAPVHQQLLIAAVAHAFLQLVDHAGRVELGLAQGLVDRGVEGAVLRRAHAVGLTFVDGDDAGARFGGGSHGGDACNSSTDDEHVAVEGLCNLGVVHGVGGGHEGGDVGGVGGFGLVGSDRFGDAGQGGGGGYRARGSNKSATRDGCVGHGVSPSALDGVGVCRSPNVRRLVHERRGEGPRWTYRQGEQAGRGGRFTTEGGRVSGGVGR